MRLYLRTSVCESAKNAGTLEQPEKKKNNDNNNKKSLVFLGIHHLTGRNLDEYLHRQINKSGKYKNTKKKKKRY